MKYWEQVLEKSNKNQTIPFIIGCKKVFNIKENFDTVESLLEEIQNSKSEKIYSMYHCSELGEYVIFQNKFTDYISNGLKVYHPKTKKLKIVFGLNMEILGKDFEQIKIKLTNRYISNIADEKFSFVNRKWEHFSNDEKETILSYSSN